MKRIFISLLLLNIFYVTCLSEDHTSEGTYSVSLRCENAPSYMIRIPESVDVSNENTIMYFYVKGDIYADQTLNIVFDDTTSLSCNGISIPVNVSQNKDTWSYNELSASYSGSSVSISHQRLSAGTWEGYIDVAISLQGGS